MAEKKDQSSHGVVPNLERTRQASSAMTLSTPYFLATDARAYEHFMARWSRRLADPFLDFAGINQIVVLAAKNAALIRGDRLNFSYATGDRYRCDVNPVRSYKISDLAYL